MQHAELLHKRENCLFYSIVLLVLVIPFLFSTTTVEQFLSPKEYVSRIVLALLCTLFCIRFIYEKQIRLSRTPIDLPLALLFLLALLSLIWNFNSEPALRDLRGTILLLLLIPLVTSTVRKLRQVEILLWIMATAGTLTALLGILEAYGIYFRLDTNSGLVYASREILNGYIDLTATYLPLFPQVMQKNGWSEGCILSTFGNRNFLATFAMFTAFIPLTFSFYYHRKWVKVLSLISFSTILMGMFATHCRAAVLGLIAGFIFIALILFLTQRKQILIKKVRWIILFIGLTISGSLLFVTQTTDMPSFLQNFKNIFSMDLKISNTAERVGIWKVTYASFSSHPSRWLVGSGFGSFPHFCQLQVAESFTENEKEAFPSIFFLQAHNDWLQLISEMGFIGFGLLLFLLWRLFRRIYFTLKKDTVNSSPAVHNSKLLLIGLTGAITALMTAALFDFPFHRIEMKLYVLTVLGLVMVLTETDCFQVSLPETGKKFDVV
jgi:O-antigen ligase